ncbi:MAG: hypothetical protein JXA82_09400 [Sedimentisphaerales bacterium]|nr:hypothetical protein [Sedimentisphaerales bacterium]
MRVILLPFMGMAFIGLVCSMIAHVGFLITGKDPFGPSPGFLDYSIFVVWLPTIIAARRTTKNDEYWQAIRRILENCPGWLKYTAGAILVYDFVFLIVGEIFGLGKDEAGFLQWYTEFRMAFYALALAILVSAYRIWKEHDLQQVV